MIRSLLLSAAVALPFALVTPAPAQTPDRPAVSESVITPGARRAERQMRRGVASYYASYFHGRRTASGERYNHNAMTVAHKTLPFGTILRVEDLRSGRRIIVRVNDRGPFIRGRVLDFSGAAADRLQMRGRGTARVGYEIVDPETLPSRRTPPPRKVRHY
ncbi:MAG: septal ring lytic transglycosylase RlpA family protein [Bacteroidota bacterium]